MRQHLLSKSPERGQRRCSNLGLFPFSQKFRKSFLEINKWNGPFRFGPTGIFGNTFEGGPRWPVWSFLSVRPTCHFALGKIVVPSTALLYLTYKNNDQTRGGLGRVCATGMCHSIHCGACGISKTANWNFCWWKASLHYQDQLSSRPEEPTSNHCQCCIARHLCFHKLATDWSVLTIESFYSYGQHLCKFIGTKESSWLRKEFNSHRIGSVWDTNLAAVSFFGRPIWPPWRHVKSQCTQPLEVPWDTHGWTLNPSHYPTGDHLLTKGPEKSRYEIKGGCNITNILQDTTISDWPRYLPPCPTSFKSPHSVL